MAVKNNLYVSPKPRQLLKDFDSSMPISILKADGTIEKTTYTLKNIRQFLQHYSLQHPQHIKSL